MRLSVLEKLSTLSTGDKKDLKKSTEEKNASKISDIYLKAGVDINVLYLRTKALTVFLNKKYNLERQDKEGVLKSAFFKFLKANKSGLATSQKSKNCELIWMAALGACSAYWLETQDVDGWMACVAAADLAYIICSGVS